MKPASLTDLAIEAHQTAVQKGWWDSDRPFGELIALCHSELSEALEEYREGKNPAYIYFEQPDPDKPDAMPKPCGIPIELADVLIRIFDLCGRYDIDIEQAVELKLTYNQSRPRRHGGKII